MSLTTDGKIELSTEFFGEKTVVLSKSGYGKSYTTRVIVEEGLAKNHTFIIIDPQDAYLNLEGFEYISAENVKSAKGLGILLSQSNKNIVLRMKRLGMDDQNMFVKTFLTEFRKHIRKGIQTIVIDEAHKYAPNQEKTASREIVRGMFQENRSDGLGCIAITQRISRLDTTIISQADNLCIGRVTSYRDKEAVKNYIDDPNDLKKISVLQRGEFYLYGFGLDQAEIKKIRKANSNHSGDSPKNLIKEDNSLYNQHISKFVKNTKETRQMDNVTTNNEVVNKVIPSMDGFMDLVKLGAKVSLGGAVGGVVGTVVGSRFASPIPMISSRTLAGAGTTIALYAGYRFMPEKLSAIKDTMKYAAAGSAVFTAGSLAFDVIALTGVRLPGLVSAGLSMASGASPMSVEKSAESGDAVDVDTNFA